MVVKGRRVDAVETTPTSAVKKNTIAGTDVMMRIRAGNATNGTGTETGLVMMAPGVEIEIQDLRTAEIAIGAGRRKSPRRRGAD